ncbi:hypothetical protein JXM67_06420, partial [candidate division WOR-3 bacterium]|nr:hypothetical protein [candidate division WOR-3 bacterium]
QWILWLFVIVDGLALGYTFIFPLIWPQHSFPLIPLWVYLLILIVGLVWVSFRVYREVTLKLPQTNLVVPLIPKLSIELIEGNEYNYHLAPKSLTPEEKKEVERMITEDNPNLDKPTLETKIQNAIYYKNEERRGNFAGYDGKFVLNLRLRNIGPVAFDVLNIKTDPLFDVNTPWTFLGERAFTENNEALNFPITFEPNKLVTCNLKSYIESHSYHTQAQFAARLSSISPGSNQTATKITIAVETSDPQGKRRVFTIEPIIFFQPLKDLYIERWQEEGETELLRLAQKGKA